MALRSVGGSSDKAGPSEQQARERVATTATDYMKELSGIELAMARIRARKRMRGQMN